MPQHSPEYLQSCLSSVMRYVILNWPAWHLGARLPVLAAHFFGISKIGA